MNEQNTPTLDTIVSLCKRRGFIFQSSEIYGGINGFFDYGPLGVELRKNIKDAWWQDMVQRRDDMVGLDCSIIMHPKVWEASGHIGGFSDPMVDCKESKNRYRADQLFYKQFTLSSEGSDETETAYAAVLENEGMEDTFKKRAKSIAKLRSKSKETKLSATIPENDNAFIDYTECTADTRALLYGPDAENPGTLTEPRDFNLMFETHVGAMRDESSVSYLRPETAQGIFAEFKNVLDTSRVKLPFGIAQIGKAFRNEITPRNFIFRSREFEQMEIEYFIAPDADWKTLHRQWLDCCINWLVSIGLPRDTITEDIHPENKLAFYSQATTDLMFRFPFGIQELWGVACRSDYDLKQHQTHSGKALDYFDEEKKERFVPHVIEPSLGVDRLLLALLTAAYCEEEVPPSKEGGKTETRTVLKFHPRMAPYKAAVFPLVKNKPELVERARNLHKRLQRRWNVFYDESGAIGRRYRRQDEIGTPYGITVDFDTLEKDGTVTLRDRDTLEQQRLSEDEVIAFLDLKING